MEDKTKILEKVDQLILSGHYNEAIEFLKKVIDDDPWSVEFLLKLAQILTIKGEIKQSVYVFKKILSIDENNTEALSGLSVLYNDIGLYEEAKKLFTRATSLAREGNQIPKELSLKIAELHLLLANHYLKAEKKSEVVRELSHAVEVSQKNVDILFQSALVYKDLKMFTKARELLTEVVGKNAQNIDAQFQLGLLAYQLGDVISAEKIWQKAKSIDPSNLKVKKFLAFCKNATETTLNI